MPENVLHGFDSCFTRTGSTGYNDGYLHGENYDIDRWEVFKDFFSFQLFVMLVKKLVYYLYRDDMT